MFFGLIKLSRVNISVGIIPFSNNTLGMGMVVILHFFKLICVECGYMSITKALSWFELTYHPQTFIPRWIYRNINIIFIRKVSTQIMTQTYPLILLMVTKYQLDESLMDDSQTYIILYGKSPPLKNLSLWHGKYRTYTGWHPNPILDHLQAVHKSIIKF